MAAKNPQFRYMYIITIVYNEALLHKETTIPNWQYYLAGRDLLMHMCLSGTLDITNAILLVLLSKSPLS